jgi:hypothetical protein
MKADAVVAVLGGALLLLGAGLAASGGGRALDMAGPLVDPDPMGAPPPAVTPAALWAGPLTAPELDPMARKGLDHHPALVVAAAARPGVASAAGHRGLAAASVDPLLDDKIAARLRLLPEERAWALDPALSDAAAAHCPSPLLGALCEPVGRAVVEAQVDAVLAQALVETDPELAAAALAAACRLGGDRGGALASPLLDHGDVRVQAAGLRLLGCAVGAAARPELEARLSDPVLGAVAALELTRLGASDALEPVAHAPTAAGIVARSAAP